MAVVTSPTAVMLESKKIKSVTASTFSPSLCHKEMEGMPGPYYFNVEFQASIFTVLFHPHQEAI